MLRSQGIDATVDRTIDAFRGKEDQLNQRYMRQKDFIDLLALTKLKNEQDAKGREINMALETDEKTID